MATTGSPSVDESAYTPGIPNSVAYIPARTAFFKAMSTTFSDLIAGGIHRATSGGTRLFVWTYDPTKPAAILIDSPRMATLNRKLRIDCASTVFRIEWEMTVTSDVWAATAIVNEK